MGTSMSEAWYEHDGSFDWKCPVCHVEGTKPYKGLVTATESPMVSDFDVMVGEVEADHALVAFCNGRVEYTGGFRHRYVKHQPKTT